MKTGQESDDANIYLRSREETGDGGERAFNYSGVSDSKQRERERERRGNYIDSRKQSREKEGGKERRGK